MLPGHPTAMMLFVVSPLLDHHDVSLTHFPDSKHMAILVWHEFLLCARLEWLTRYHVAMAQAMQFTADIKLSHYMKIVSQIP